MVLWKRCSATSMLAVSAMNPMGRSSPRSVLVRGGPVQVLDVDVADDVVDVLLEHRVAGVVGLLDLGDGLGDRGRRGQERRLGAGHHDVADRPVAERESAAHEDLLHLVDVPALLAGLEDHAQLFLGVGQVALGRGLDAGTA